MFHQNFLSVSNLDEWHHRTCEYLKKKYENRLLNVILKLLLTHFERIISLDRFLHSETIMGTHLCWEFDFIRFHRRNEF